MYRIKTTGHLSFIKSHGSSPECVPDRLHLLPLTLLLREERTRSGALGGRGVGSVPGRSRSRRFLPLQSVQLFNVRYLHRGCGIVVAHLPCGRLGDNFGQPIWDLGTHELEVVDLVSVSVSVGGHFAQQALNTFNLQKMPPTRSQLSSLFVHRTERTITYTTSTAHQRQLLTLQTSFSVFERKDRHQHVTCL